MADLRRMTLRSLRALARRRLGAAAATLTTKDALVRALARASEAAKPARRGKRAGVTPAPLAASKAKRKVTEPKAKRKIAAPAQAPGPAAEGAEPDPAGFFVARVRGEGAVRGAPHAMLEEARPPTSALALRADEQLGDLPASYGEDTLALLPRDPTSLFAFWDHSERTLRDAFRALARPRVELWLWARAGDGWERVRVVELALEPRGWYLHGLEPGRGYRAELRVLDDEGRERALGPGSGEVGLPPAGPSPLVDDRFVRIPWDQPLGPPLGPGHRGPELPLETRQALAELSAWPEGPSSGRPSSPGGGGER
jgi:hypothetical protein